MNGRSLRRHARQYQLSCLLGLHRHGPTFRVGRHTYSECLHCGGDLIRANHRWRRPRPNEVPARWRAKPHRQLRGRVYIALVIMLSLVVTAEAFYCWRLLAPA
ncbi:hypothetical protein [Sphingomonas crusticola]|uniref:hypothetical protein n=1 Tax=Sphingomonas crusticola TaxID=1697973 RepID=UPI0013C34B5B|nr:hypothetical protein [Sphingomonas crusticola]